MKEAEIASPYTERDLELAKRRQHLVAARKGEARRLAGGEKFMQVDPVLFHNARIQNQRDHGVDNCWDEKEFVRDMARRHPEIRVRSQGKPIFSAVGFKAGGRGRLIANLGRVTFHKVYP